MKCLHLLHSEGCHGALGWASGDLGSCLPGTCLVTWTSHFPFLDLSFPVCERGRGEYSSTSGAVWESTKCICAINLSQGHLGVGFSFWQLSCSSQIIHKDTCPLSCLLDVYSCSLLLSLLLSGRVFICLSGLREVSESHSVTPAHSELERFLAFQ